MNNPTGRLALRRTLVGILVGGGLLVGMMVAGTADAPRSLVILAPLVAAAGVLLGGWRPAKGSDGSSAGSRVVLAKEVPRYALPVVVLTATAALSVFVLPDLGSDTESRVVASALAFDFTVSVPVLVFVLLVRTRRAPWITVVPAFVVGYALAVATIPPEHDAVLETVKLLALPAELAFVIYLVVLTRRAWADSPGGIGDPATRFRSTARRVIGSRIPADVLTTELTILYYAFRGRNLPEETATSFTMHRRAGYSSVVFGLTIVVLVETVAMHMLLRLWSSTAAWILTGLSVYALVWLVGDYRAIVARPIRITTAHLQIRLGVRWEADIPHRNVAHVDLLRSPIGKPTGDTLVVALLGQPNLRVKLEEPVEVMGMYGVRRIVRNLWLRVDEPTELCAALSPAGVDGTAL